jgi:hypothetical protein
MKQSGHHTVDRLVFFFARKTYILLDTVYFRSLKMIKNAHSCTCLKCNSRSNFFKSGRDASHPQILSGDR